ncbi:peptidoglycan/LPS O-acetylase OafA/YrhL [Streptomyces africanus]|uniref:Peptidoglycan/LPS O-acetylase OafA/YrhL n=1 Tax=Streptomyces africanus TaxID=231024 RepID=A0ABU0R169_9ACTN|nr:acyltransferase [Streptomyces africanus]MDQ0753399.1 peptidoglycan/LPS O-acetylase OafA/YrhL [Streptomyces africanus]
MEPPPLVPASPPHALSRTSRFPNALATAGPSRSGWLDALRGIAALVVVFDHSSYTFMPEFRRELMPEFNTSRYGIMVFFLVSGYIIPASLERRGCVRTFWVGRFFRVYPLWAVVVTVLLALNLSGIAELRDFGGQGAVTVAVAHATMLQELLGTPNLLLVLWTLSYEMSFYLLVVALFTVRLHQRSAAVSVVLAGLAAVSVTTGVVLPVSALSGLVGNGPLIAIAAIAMVVAIGCASTGAPVLRGFGGVLGGVLALVLVPLNGTVPLWEGLVILAVMFLGTAVHRAENGQGTWRDAAVTAVLVVACAVGSAYGYGDVEHFTRRGWIVAFLLAVLTFGAGLWSRRLRIPRVPAGLGTISYSVYLVHPVLLTVIDNTIGRRRQDSLALEVAFIATLLPLCLLTYRCVEAPSQTWGRRVARRVRPSDDERQRHSASEAGA